MSENEQYQTVADIISEDVKENAPAGEVKEGQVDTATTDTGLESKKSDELSIEEIVTGKPVQGDDLIPEDKVMSPKAQEKLEKRINANTKEKNLALIRAEKAEKRVRQLEIQKELPANEPMVPDRDAFENHEEYQKAYSKYQEDLNSYSAAQTSIKTVVQGDSDQREVNENLYFEQVGKLKERFPDAHEVIQGTYYGGRGGPLETAILNSPHRAEIGLYFAKNLASLEKTINLPVEAMHKEIGKLEARLESATKIKTTDAPAPLNTVSGEDAASIQDIDEIKDDDKWHKQYMKQKLKKLKER